MSVEFKKVVQELIVPELKEIKLEQKNLNTQIDSFRNEMKTEIHRLDDKMDSFRNEVRAEIGSVKTEVGSLRSEMKVEIRRIDEKLDIALEVRERLAILESKVAVSGN